MVEKFGGELKLVVCTVKSRLIGLKLKKIYNYCSIVKSITEVQDPWLCRDNLAMTLAKHGIYHIKI